MEKGQNVEEGTHESLLRDKPNGVYARLVKQAENAKQDEMVVEKEAEVERSKKTPVVKYKATDEEIQKIKDMVGEGEYFLKLFKRLKIWLEKSKTFILKI